MNDTAPFTLRKADLSDIEWVDARYKEIEFQLSDYQKEIIAIVECDGKRAGLGRLTRIDPNSVELGGMYVLPPFRKKGIAKEIVSFLLKFAKAEETVYCIPFVHLLPFYETFGFVPVKKMALLPNPILTKYSWCKENHSPDTSLMILKKG